MATHRLSLLGAMTMPDSTGNVWFEPAGVTQSNDRFPQMVLRFKDTATLIKVGGRFLVPKNYVGTPKVFVKWTTTATSGDAIWTWAHSKHAAGTSLDPSADTETGTVTTAAPASSQLEVESSITLTAANFAAGEMVEFAVGRNGAGSDTIAADLVMYGLVFEYADA